MTVIGWLRLPSRVYLHLAGRSSPTALDAHPVFVCQGAYQLPCLRK